MSSNPLFLNALLQSAIAWDCTCVHTALPSNHRFKLGVTPTSNASASSFGLLHPIDFTGSGVVATVTFKLFATVAAYPIGAGIAPIGIPAAMATTQRINATEILNCQWQHKLTTQADKSRELEGEARQLRDKLTGVDVELTAERQKHSTATAELTAERQKHSTATAELRQRIKGGRAGATHVVARDPPRLQPQRLPREPS